MPRKQNKTKRMKNRLLTAFAIEKLELETFTEQTHPFVAKKIFSLCVQHYFLLLKKFFIDCIPSD